MATSCKAEAVIDSELFFHWNPLFPPPPQIVSHCCISDSVNSVEQPWVFLFDADVRKYLDGLREGALALHTKNEQLRAMREEDRRRNALIDGIAALETEFVSEY